MTEFEYKPGDKVRFTVEGTIDKHGLMVLGDGHTLNPGPRSKGTLELLERAEEYHDVVPGTVLVGKADPAPMVVTPGGFWTARGGTYDFEANGGTGRWPKGYYDVVFDPRDANPLPSPLGVRVGDAVRRVQKGDHATVTTEFQVNHIDRQIGYAYPKYGLGHPVDELEVVGREVSDRLPAGTIYRQRGRLFLRDEHGYIDLTDGEHFTSNATDTDLRRGVGEVIYLPES